MSALVRSCYWSGYQRALVDRGTVRQSVAFLEANRLGDRGHLDLAMDKALRAWLLARGELDRNRSLAAQWTDRPIMTRPALAAATAERARRRGEVLLRTGGSTGEPVGLYVSRAGLRSKRSRLIACRTAVGWRPGMDVFGIWGSNADIGRPDSRTTALREWLSGFHLDAGFTSSGARWDVLADRIESTHRPVCLYGYSSLLSAFGAHLGATDRQLRNVIAVWNGAEPITDSTRAAIRSATGQEVQDFYGARETGALATQLPGQSVLSVVGPRAMLEVVDAQGQPVPEGSEGRVLVTLLNDGGSSIVRYEIGDLAVAGTRLTIGHASLQKIVGRVNDAIPLVDGGTVQGLALNHLMKEFEEVQQFQLIVDPKRRSARLLLLPFDSSSVNERSAELAVERLLREYRVTSEVVSEIPRTSHGKLRQVIVQ